MGKLGLLLRSRKFWTLVGSLVVVLGGYATGEVTVWQAVSAAVAALALYSGATALEDGLTRRD